MIEKKVKATLRTRSAPGGVIEFEISHEMADKIRKLQKMIREQRANERK